MKRTTLNRGLTLGAVAVASLFAGAVVASRLDFTATSCAQHSERPAPAAVAPAVPAGSTLAAIAEEEKKFVVNINTTKSDSTMTSSTASSGRPRSRR